jgi:hypothetical protein
MTVFLMDSTTHHRDTVAGVYFQASGAEGRGTHGGSLYEEGLQEGRGASRREAEDRGADGRGAEDRGADEVYEELM